MRVYEYVDWRGNGVFIGWYRGLPTPQRAALDVKLKAVMRAGEAGDLRYGELPPGMFRGPVSYRGKRYPNTYKLTVNGNVALRPLACKGPIRTAEEWTILLPVIEVGGSYPDGCFSQAEARRLDVMADPDNRRREITNDDI